MEDWGVRTNTGLLCVVYWGRSRERPKAAACMHTCSGIVCAGMQMQPCMCVLLPGLAGLPIQVATWVGWGRSDTGDAGRMLWRDCEVVQLLHNNSFRARCFASSDLKGSATVGPPPILGLQTSLETSLCLLKWARLIPNKHTTLCCLDRTHALLASIPRKPLSPRPRAPSP